MEIMVPVLLFVLGMVIIIKGGDYFVDAAIWISDITGIPRFIVGATIVSFATTLPELFVSLIATVQGSAGISFGNAIGSVSCNLGLIMGVSLAAMPSAKAGGEFFKKGAIMVVSTIVVYFLARDGVLSVFNAVILLIILVFNLGQSIMDGKKDAEITIRKKIENKREVTVNVVKFAVGIAGIIIGAQLLVDNGTLLARYFGVPESVIGLTLIALGTSLPEFVTTITSIVKREPSLSVGNILGANILNMIFVLPICALASGGTMTVLPEMYVLNIPFALAFMAVAIIPTIFSKKFMRWQGFALLAVYAAYVTVLVR